MKNETITLKSIVESEIPLKDKFWFICKKLVSKEENKQIAISVAEIVLPIYEKRYPEDARPREAIEAAKQFIAGHVSINTLIEKRRAAYTAADAADAAYAAADAAAYAAYAAYAAAYAADAADAAYAAAYAAYAAYAADAADAADVKESLLNYLLKLAGQ